MNVLVIGGTGTVGSQTITGLISRGISMRVMTRSTEKAFALAQETFGVIGDMENPSTLPAAFKGVDKVFLITPQSPNEAQQGLAAVEAAQAAGVHHIVYLSVPLPPGSTHIPHYKSKILIEQALKNSGIDYTILRPNNFYQNDFWFQKEIAQYGTYPQPIGKIGINRVDVRDISEAAVNALTEPGHEGNIYPVNGPDVLTGESVAELFSRYLGREVRYGGDDLDTWAQQALNRWPEWMVNDLRIMYQYFQECGLRATVADFAQQQRILHHEPRTFEAFVSEIAPAWKGS